MKAPEGVAAPLEPSTARQWLISGGGGHEDGEDGIRACTMPMEHAIELMDEFAEFHAAAVSKNLQEELSEIINPIFDEDARKWSLKEKLESAVRINKRMTEWVERLEESESRLEKEITALRETKL